MQTGPSPSEIRKARRLLIGAMVLAWATHLLVAQWSHAATVEDEGPTTLVIRADARITGSTIRLNDICHLEGTHAQALAGCTVGFIPDAAVEAKVTLNQIVRTIEEAGISAAMLQISGATECHVLTTGAAPSQGSSAGGEWSAIEPDAVRPARAETISRRSMPLEERLREDLAARLGVEASDLTLSFSRRDDEVVTSAANAGPLKLIRGGDDLGRTTWEMEIEGCLRQVTADASLAVRQLVAARPIGKGQTLQAGDVAQEMKTISRLADRTPRPVDAIGAAAERDLAQGEVITFKKLAPTLLVERGQFVMVRVSRGAVEVRLLARAQESGGFGQVIRATNEQTGDSLYVTLTGPQAGVMRPDTN